MCCERVEIKRGGCLDKLVQISSLGKLGIETTAQWGYEDAKTGEFFYEDPMERVIRTRKAVIANYYISEPKITRRVVNNKG